MVAYVKSDGTMVNQLSVGAGNVLDVNLVGGVIPPPVGGATEAEQQAQTALLTSIDGNIVACNTGAVVVSSSALPTGAATEATLSALNGKVTAVNTGAVTVSSSALPTGAATSAKQPALGTAGTASADVITVQGIASMTALKVDGSAVTQPISAASLPLPTGAALDATLTGGSQVTAIKQGGNTATVSASGALKVDGSATTQPISAASLPLPTGAATNLSMAQPTTSIAITPSDSTDLTATVTKGLWVGTAGNLSIKLSADSAAVTLSNVPSGTYVPGAYARIMAATTATNIVGFGG